MSLTDELKKQLDDAGVEAPHAENLVSYMLECEDGGAEDLGILFEEGGAEIANNFSEPERLKIMKAILFDYGQFLRSLA